MSKPVDIKYFVDQPTLYGHDHQVGAGGKGLPNGSPAGHLGSLPEANARASAEVMATSA